MEGKKMTTITTKSQGPQIRLIVLMGLAFMAAAVAVAAIAAVNRPTAATEPGSLAAQPTWAALADAATEARISSAYLDDIAKQAAAFEQAIENGGRPGYIETSSGATDRVAPLPDSIADAQDRANAQARIADREAAALLPDSIADAQDRANAQARIADREAADALVRWDDNASDVKFLNGFLDDSSREDPVEDWKWPMANDQIL